ncbi:DNA primase [Altericroceibacterium endophyticum]|uniref:DNA primase n=1 Tax=Altericroceibacterium endophyticum TaxID=1808508 RepID=A0A6I4T0H5_9SPHN|nr:DNA primase [Altericroceibacterium endophyticum]MXO64604.1 DNA primase [Altericroceibacterium endophyticum]
MALSPQWLDELRARITLSSVIQRTTKLQRAGREWKACCPFHNENTPSFTVSDEKGFYHCFGCGAHGDAIRWMTDQRGLSFIDAVKELAAEAGLDVPQPDPREARRAEQRASLHDVMEAAQQWFRSNLESTGGESARRYLDSRGFDALTMERFGFGFAPPDRTALPRALSDFEESMLIEAGLRIEVENRDPYDRFRNRLMLPIHDARGRIIAFGGRILDSSNKDAPKYLNSPDTPLFDKGRTLYNLHRAGPASRQTKRMVVVEGYMDVVALAAAGIEEAVAPLGTALTERQIELLWRVTDRPLLCFDGDAAGQRAAMRAVSRALPLLQPDRSLAIVTLPEGLDPDDLLKQHGRAALERLLSEPKSVLDVLWTHERDSRPLDTPEDKAGLKQRLLDHVDTIQQSDIRSLYRRELMDRYSAFAFPKREFSRSNPNSGSSRMGGSGRSGSFGGSQSRLSPETAGRLKRAAAGGGRDMLAQCVIAGLARFPKEIERHAEQLARFEAGDAETARIVGMLLDVTEALEEEHENTISAIETLAAPPDNAHFSFLMEGPDPQVACQDLAEAVALLVERPALDRAIAETTARFASDPDGSWAEQQRLRKRKLEIESRLGHMARERAAGPSQNEKMGSPSEPDPGEQKTD